MPDESTPPDHPAYEKMRLVVDALATGADPIGVRLLAAARHFPDNSQMRTVAERHLWLRIGAALVEGGPEGHEDERDDDDRHVAESVARLDETRLVEIARDMLRLYELVAGVRTDDPYDLKRTGAESRG
jgi:hypothetical protein